jgi:NADH:ubiquinone oxidoreductase subunit H
MAGMLHSTTVSLWLAAWASAAVYVAVALLETSVHPYDVLECEPELVSGYYVDYGGVAFMVIYLAEGILLLVSQWMSTSYPVPQGQSVLRPLSIYVIRLRLVASVFIHLSILL